MNAITPSAASSLLASLGASAAQFHEQEDASALSVEKSTPQPSSHYSPGVTSSIEERARELLGSGISSEAVAAALGVTPSRIAQLLSNESFADSVAKLRYENLQQHNRRDSHYDAIEDKLLEKLEKSLPLLFKPQDILRAITTVNGAKRRGQSSPDQVTNQQNIVNLILPVNIAQKFSVNIDNQVIRAGEQELLTMPSGNLLKQVEAASASKTALTHQKVEKTELQTQEVQAPQQETEQLCEPTNTRNEELLRN